MSTLTSSGNSILRNVTGSDDPFTKFGYTIPSIQTQLVAHNTIILNINAIAKALNRNPDELLKMFTYKRSTSLIPKRNMLNGTHTMVVLQNDLKEYIALYVMCNSCKSSKTVYTKQLHKLCKSCKACGANNFIKGDEKLINHINNNM